MSHRQSVFIVFCLALLAVNGSAQVLVNQSGYNTADSKRFTAPLAADGTPFSIISNPAGTPVFSGTVTAGLGDFSDFKPVGTANFRVQLGGETSHTFGIGPFWIERVSYRRMVQFFIDSRAGYGDATTWNVAGGKFSSGIAWRDSHQFSFELRTLIPWYAANPDAFGTDRMPIEGTYNGLRNTLPADAPEIVRLIHWGVDIYLRGSLNHTLIKEELAYFVYYYPLMQQWIPLSLYNEARDFLFANWSNPARDRWNWYDISHTGNLFQTYTVMGGTKGSLPPGHSIVPNLLMHAVALREGQANAVAYLTAARNQVQWIVNNKLPTDPLMTKGQRMSEHILVPALAEFMMRDPQTTVTGVDAWLTVWTDTVISRSNNYWDFRKYTDTLWTPENVPGGHPWWNEPGNIAGFPASALAAATRMTDPVKVNRLRQISVSQLDQVFGRNPYNRHYSFRGAQANYGFEGVETGWFSQHIGGLGDLVNVRGVLDASAKHLSFPYNPTVAPGYVEGWVAFNSAWNNSMAWAARDRSSISFLGADAQGAVGATSGVEIELKAPLNFDRSLAETARVRIISSIGDVETLILTETGPDTAVFRGSISMGYASIPSVGNGSLEAVTGSDISASYAHDIFARTVSAAAASTADAPLIITTNLLPSARVESLYTPVMLNSGNADGAPSWEIIAGSLPAGMQLLANGTLQGTATATGHFPLTFRVTAGGETAEKNLTLSSSAIQISTLSLGGAGVGTPYQQPLLTSGALGQVTWSSASGSPLPGGLTLDPAGIISGTPVTAGTYNLNLTATDSSALTASSSYQLLVVSTTAGVILTDSFDAGSGSWFKAAPVTGDSLSVVGGQLEWMENGTLMQEVIGRPLPETSLAVGQSLRLSFDYRQNGAPNSSHLIRAGFYNLATPIADHNWAGNNTVGAWRGYGTFVRDDSTNTATNVARTESGTTTSNTAGPNNGTPGAYTDIGTKITQFNLNDEGTTNYQFSFEVNFVSPTRMDTLLTVSSTLNGIINTHFSIPGSQTSGTLQSTFNTIVLKQAGGLAMPAYYDNVKVELSGGTSPAIFTDWQSLNWPGNNDPAITGPLADPDGDGIINLLEWALNLDGTQPDGFTPTLARDGDFLLYTYTRRKIAPGEASFEIEWSDTLGSDWSAAGVTAYQPVSTGVTTESIIIAVPADSGEKRFVRLRLSRP